MVTDRWMDGQMDQWTDRQKAGWTNGWTIFLSYIATIDASENYDFPTYLRIFTKALLTVLVTNRPTDGLTLL